MRENRSVFWYPYLLALLLPAVVLNGLTLAIAWHEGAAGDEVVAEVEILGRGELQSGDREPAYLVRLHRLLSGAPEKDRLWISLGDGADVRGPMYSSWGSSLTHAELTTGSRLFVVMRRDHCRYRVDHFWFGAPSRALDHFDSVNDGSVQHPARATGWASPDVV